MSTMRVALVQLSADADVAANMERAGSLVECAGQDRPDLIALPELFLYRGPAAGFRASATEVPGPMTEPFADLARFIGCWILLGSLAERSSDPERPYNTSVLLDPSGEIRARYRKRHLFDVTIENGPSDRESARTTPGEEAVVVDVGDAGAGADGGGDAGGSGGAGGAEARLGLSICYDLRFPEHYRELARGGATILAVPANFTEATGRDHWEVLLRARAIENGAFVIAPAQCGVGGGIPAHGRSMAIDPWGVVIAQAPDGPGFVTAELDLERVARVRRQLPTQPR